MQTQTLSLNNYATGRRTNHILIIDDNAKLRSLFARHILFACRYNGRSCALYHIGENAQTCLNFAEPEPDSFSVSSASANLEVDFAVYESNSPRQALNWLHSNSIRRLIIVSDVMMPVDTEVGLDGFLDGIAALGLAVSLLFMSSETQSRDIVQQLMAPQKTHFFTKGGESWSNLPEALVRNAEQLPYRPVQRSLVADQAFASTLAINNSYAMATVPLKKSANSILATNSLHTPTVAKYESDTTSKQGFWSRLFSLFHS